MDWRDIANQNGASSWKHYQRAENAEAQVVFLRGRLKVAIFVACVMAVVACVALVELVR